MLPSITLSPIGVVRTPFSDRVSAPRQAVAASGAPGSIELLPGRGFEHAVEDLEGWEYLWILFWFHLNTGWRPKVLPPRSAGKRRGVFSTRSPHRPNPIGLSVVKLESINGLTIHIRNVDMVDGSPVLDIKPYVPYADAFPDARTGWLKPLSPDAASSTSAPPVDPESGFSVAWSERAAEQIHWLTKNHQIDLKTPVERTLSLGPQPHPYRRIRPDGDAMRLAVKDWRVRFRAEGRLITVQSITTGYRDRQLAEPGGEPAIVIHREFMAIFGDSPR